MKNLTEQVRDRVWHSLSSDTADIVGLRLDQLQQFTLGGCQLSQEQIKALARHFGIRERG